MIRLTGKFTIKPDQRDVFLEALMANKKGVEEKEKRFLEMRLYTDNKDPNVIFAYEIIQDQEAFDFHLQQEHTKEFIKVAEKTLACPPEIYTLNETTPAPLAFNERKQPIIEDDIFVIFFMFKIKEGYKEKLIERFETHVTETRKEDGCLLFDMYTIEGKDDYLFVYEHWRKESDVWDVHMKTPYSEITGALMEEAVVGDMKQYMSFVEEIVL